MLSGYSKNSVILQKYEPVDKKINAFKSDMFIQAVNSSYTFAFIMTLLIAFTGFTVYWILNMKDRELQFGIIRSLGISKLRVYKMLLLEQTISTFAAIVVGTFIGNTVFKFFGSVTSIRALKDAEILPTIITYIFSDYVRLFLAIGLMILIVMFILIVYISNLKITQAIKLGED